MKKFLICLFSILFAFSFIACAKTKPQNDTPTITAKPDVDVVNETTQPTNNTTDILTEYTKIIKSQKVYLLSYKEFPVDDIYVLNDDSVKDKFDTASITVLMITPSEYDSYNSTYDVNINGGLEHTEYADYHGTYWVDKFTHKNEHYDIEYALIILKAYGKIDFNTFDLQLVNNYYSSKIHNEYISMDIITNEKTLDDVPNEVLCINNNHYLFYPASGYAEGIGEISQKIKLIPLDCKFEKVTLDIFDTKFDESDDLDRNISFEYVPDHMVEPKGSTVVEITRKLESSSYDETMWNKFITLSDSIIIKTDTGDFIFELAHR